MEASVCTRTRDQTPQTPSSRLDFSPAQAPRAGTVGDTDTLLSPDHDTPRRSRHKPAEDGGGLATHKPPRSPPGPDPRPRSARRVPDPRPSPRPHGSDRIHAFAGAALSRLTRTRARSSRSSSPRPQAQGLGLRALRDAAPRRGGGAPAAPPPPSRAPDCGG